MAWEAKDEPDKELNEEKEVGATEEIDGYGGYRSVNPPSL